MKLFKLIFCSVSAVLAIDYSSNGANWKTGQCANGTRQSPIDISSSSAVPNSNLNFWWNYNAIEDATLVQADGNASLYIDMS